MNTSTLCIVGAAAIGGAVSGGVVAAGFVNLQDATPGTAQPGHINVTGTAIAGKVRVGTTVAGGALLRVEDAGTSGGVYSRSGGNGVYSESTGTAGPLIGGQFIARSTTGRGLIGSATAATGSTRGGIFDSKSTTGVGVYGLSSATSGSGVGVFGSATAATGSAIVASNPNAGHRVELAGPNGAMYLGTGHVTRNYGAGPRVAIPIAYGTVDVAGTIYVSGEGSGNWSVTKFATGGYRITITGENYSFGPFVTVANATYGGYCSTASNTGNLLIETFNDAGVPTDMYITFVAYKSVPGAAYPATPRHGFRDDLAWAQKRPAEFKRYAALCREAEARATHGEYASERLDRLP